MKKQRVKPGDILEIPLPGGRFAYGKLFKDAAIGVYDSIASNRLSLPIGTKFMFVVGVYKDQTTSGKWPRVGHEPFPDEDASWPPPAAIEDPISGAWSIYHHGEIHPADAATASHLEIAAVWDEDEIIERIVAAAPTN